MNGDQESRRQHPPGPDRLAGYDTRGALTIPNLLTFARLGGSLALIACARAGSPSWFIAVFVTLLVTDWLDGKIAILFHQRSVLGARLDSLADSVLSACLLIGLSLLRPEFFQSDAILIAAMIASYAIAVLLVLAKFGRLPAYHTRAAKASWWLVAISAVTLVAGGPEWPARVALIAVTVTNLEAIAISIVLDRWQSDLPSIWHALRARSE